LHCGREAKSFSAEARSLERIARWGPRCLVVNGTFQHHVATKGWIVMPPHCWTSDPSAAVISFGQRFPDGEVAALLLWAVHSVDALHYLADVDTAFERAGESTEGHAGHVVDVAHARWATSTSITALDLCAAGLARAFGGHKGPLEVDLGQFAAKKPGKHIKAIMTSMPAGVLSWIKVVLADADFARIVEVRHALTHRRLPRNLYARLAPEAPDRRIDLYVSGDQVSVRRLVEQSRDLATTHVADLLSRLPGF
jgi:hypothetical protein